MIGRPLETFAEDGWYQRHWHWFVWVSGVYSLIFVLWALVGGPVLYTAWVVLGVPLFFVWVGMIGFITWRNRTNLRYWLFMVALPIALSFLLVLITR